MKHFRLTCLLILVCVTLLWADDQKAFDFTLTDLQGDNVTLSDVYANKIVILDFWGINCPPCRAELPHLQEIEKHFGSDRVQVLAVTSDPKRLERKVKSFIEMKKFDFTVLLDFNGDVSRLYSVQAIPQTFIIDSNGTILKHTVGYRAGEEKHLFEAVEKAVATLPATDQVAPQKTE